MNVLSERIKQARLNNNLSQKELGELIEPGSTTISTSISHYELSKHEPNFSRVKKISLILDLPVCYFYCEDNDLADFVIYYNRLDEGKKELLKDFFNNFIKT